MLNEEHAVQIAPDGNTRDAASGYTDFVTRFRVRADLLGRYPVRPVGGRSRQEYWISAAELAAFNENIVGPIEVMQEFPGRLPEASR